MLEWQDAPFVVKGRYTISVDENEAITIKVKGPMVIRFGLINGKSCIKEISKWHGKENDG